MHKFPLNFWYWESILKRRLKQEEKERIKSVYAEKEMNKVIRDIHNMAKKNGLYIPKLTENDGNCLFWSLCYYDFANDITSLKKGISNMLMFFKDMKNFIPGQEMPLSELFALHNDIEYVYCYKEQKLYKYNYDAMCMDIITNDGWKRINTELLFTVLSIIMNIRFQIYHDNGHITKICPNEKEDTKNIFLAQLGECHYIPLDIISDNIVPKCLEYTESWDDFIEWGEKILTGQFDSDSDSDRNEDNKYCYYD